MKYKVSHYSSIIVLVGIVAWSMVRVQAQVAPTELEQFADAVVSLSTGQTLRISVVNPLPPAEPGADGRKFKMLVAATILDANGRVIARNEITLDPGQFHSFKFSRADLSVPGEAGTDPLQLRSEIRRRFFQGFHGQILVASGDVNDVVELVDDFTGQTQAAALLRTVVDLTSSSEQIQVQPGLLGLAHGQSLRVNVAHLDQSGEHQQLRARVEFHDAIGNLIAQSGELVISPKGFGSYDLPRSALPLTGEPGTGRVQMAANIFLKFDPGKFDAVAVTLELVDNSTGRTTALLLPAVQKLRNVNSCSSC